MVAVFLVYKDLVNGRFGKRVSVYLLAYFHHPQSNQAFGGLFIAMVSCFFGKLLSVKALVNETFEHSISVEALS